MRELAPAAWRVGARAMMRAVVDAASGDAWRMVRGSEARRGIGRGLREQLSMVQPIRWSELCANKVHNLRLAALSIEDVTVDPGELFSFWALVGRPSGGRGYLAGRTLINGGLHSSTGGGLCQLSGILHAAALSAGLLVRERHAHSLDIYNDRTRFAPLGSDATVAYGYKDLRFINCLAGQLCFRFRISESEICVAVCAGGPITEHKVEHRYLKGDGDGVSVETLRTSPTGEQTSLYISHYRKPEAEGGQ